MARIKGAGAKTDAAKGNGDRSADAAKGTGAKTDAAKGRGQPLARLPDETIRVEDDGSAEAFKVRSLPGPPMPANEKIVIDPATAKLWGREAENERRYRLAWLKTMNQHALDLQEGRRQTMSLAGRLILISLGGVAIVVYVVVVLAYGSPAERSAALPLLAGLATSTGGFMLLGQPQKKKKRRDDEDEDEDE